MFCIPTTENILNMSHLMSFEYKEEAKNFLFFNAYISQN